MDTNRTRKAAVITGESDMAECSRCGYRKRKDLFRVDEDGDLVCDSCWRAVDRPPAPETRDDDPYSYHAEGRDDDRRRGLGGSLWD